MPDLSQTTGYLQGSSQTLIQVYFKQLIMSFVASPSMAFNYQMNLSGR